MENLEFIIFIEIVLACSLLIVGYRSWQKFKGIRETEMEETTTRRLLNWFLIPIAVIVTVMILIPTFAYVGG